MVKDYELSQQIFERKRKGILKSKADVVTTSCPACRIQLKNGLRKNLPVKHVVQVIAETYPL